MALLDDGARRGIHGNKNIIFTREEMSDDCPEYADNPGDYLLEIRQVMPFSELKIMYRDTFHQEYSFGGEQERQRHESKYFYDKYRRERALNEWMWWAVAEDLGNSKKK